MQQTDNINPTSSHASREEKWDFLRGIAIYFVILGHTVQWMDADWKHNPLFEGIYSFHMPLFIFISGYFLRNNLQEIAFWKWQKQKTRQLLIPSLFNSLIYSALLLIPISWGISTRLAQWDAQALWYLNVLWLLLVFARIVACFPFRFLRILLWMGAYAFVFFWHYYPLSMYAKFMLPFFLLGHLYRKLTQLPHPLRLFLLAAGSLLWWFVLPLWDFSHSIYMLPYAPSKLTNMLHYLILYANGFGGICNTLLLIEGSYARLERFASLQPFVKSTAWVGTITLPIYVVQTHFFIIREVVKGFSRNYLLQIVTALSLVLFCWAVYRILSKVPFLRLLLFGEKNSHS